MQQNSYFSAMPNTVEICARQTKILTLMQFLNSMSSCLNETEIDPSDMEYIWFKNLCVQIFSFHLFKVKAQS